MKTINAFECDFCGKILKTKYWMKQHELKCFRNPETKSCITCKNLCQKPCLNGKPVSKQEELILQFKIDGTYHKCNGVMECDYNELNNEYSYLNNAQDENCCNAQNVKLVKLKTKCQIHQT